MLRNSVIAFTPSSRPSSILTSMICAPPSTCALAISTASPYLPSFTSLRNFLEPATFVLSPTFTKFVSFVTTRDSRPESFKCLSFSVFCADFLGLYLLASSAMAFICSGVVPQQPPTIFINPSSRYDCNISLIICGDWSYSPKGFGNPALGCAEILKSVATDNLLIYVLS